MQPDSSETVYVESTHASLLRRLGGNAPTPEEASPMPDIGSATVQPQGQPVAHASAYSLPIHCLFTAYSLPIHCLFTAYSLQQRRESLLPSTGVGVPPVRGELA
jgi:hypothetical protein